MTKIAIPVKDDLLSKNFDSCAYLLIYEITDRRIVGKKVDFFQDNFIQKITEWSERSEITDIIAHYIGENYLEVLSPGKINLFVGVKINSPDRLVEDFLNGTLKSDPHIIAEKCMIL